MGPQAAAACFESQGHLWPTVIHLRRTFGLHSPYQARPPHPSCVAVSECFTAGHPQFPCSVKWAHRRGPLSWSCRVQRHVALDGTALQSQLLRRLRQEDRLKSAHVTRRDPRPALKRKAKIKSELTRTTLARQRVPGVILSEAPGSLPHFSPSLPVSLLA